MLNIVFCPKKTGMLSLAPETAHSLNLKDGTRYFLHFGLWREEVRVTYASHPPDEAVLSLTSQSIINWPNRRLHLKVDGPEIRLGPVMGVYLNHQHVLEIARGKLGESAEELGIPDMMDAAEKLGVFLYYFSIETVQPENLSVEGMTRAEHKWMWRTVPLPDIIYDRSYHQSYNAHQRGQRLFKALMAENKTKLINTRRIVSKRDFSDLLSRFPITARYLPKTWITTDYQLMIDKLSEYKQLVIKPMVGHSGRDILVISPDKNGWKIDYLEKDEPASTYVGSKQELIKLCKNRYGNNTFIIQQYIDKICYHGRPLDLRIMLQKNREGRWNTTYKNIRLAPKGCFFTITDTGTTFWGLSQMLPRLLERKKADAAALENQILRVSFIAADYLDRYLGPFGELGIDLALDNNLNIWLLEANAMAWKGPKEGTLMELQHRYPVEYALFLTGF